MDDTEFQKWGHEICNFLIDYKTNIENVKVTPGVSPGFLRGKLRKTVTEEGEDFGKVFDDFRGKVLPGIVNWCHPMNFSTFPSPNTYPCVLGDMLSASIGGVGFAWKSCPSLTELENLMCDWYARMLGIPSKFTFDGSSGKGGGSYQQTTTDVIYNILTSARYMALKIIKQKNKSIDKYDCIPKLTVYASEECHLCVKRLCDIEFVTFRLIKVDEDGAMSVSDLDKQIKQDVKSKLIPILVVATVGSFVKFALDDIDEIHDITKKYPTIWLHADATYGGNAMLIKRYRYMRNHLELCHSVAASPNKWLEIGLDCPVLWVENAEHFTKVFLVSAAYLVSEKKDAIDLRHYGIALSRRFRALKMWFIFRTYGTHNLEMALRTYIHYAHLFSEELKKSSSFAVVFTAFTFVNFVLKGKRDEQNKQFLVKVNKSRKILLHGVKFNGKYTLRVSITYPNTNSHHIKNAVRLLESFARSV